MTDAEVASDPVKEGEVGMTAPHSLKAQLRHADRMSRLTAVALVAPLMLFVAFSFAVPLAGIIWRSVDDREVARVLPDTMAALADCA